MNKKNIVGGMGRCGAWTPDLLSKCRDTKAKVWTNNGSIYSGFVDIFEKGSSEDSDMLVLRMSLVTLEKINPFTYEQIEVYEFNILQYGDPVFINEVGYDAVWASFLGGYFCIYFACP